MWLLSDEYLSWIFVFDQESGNIWTFFEELFIDTEVKELLLFITIKSIYVESIDSEDWRLMYVVLENESYTTSNLEHIEFSVFKDNLLIQLFYNSENLKIYKVLYN